MFNQDPPSPTVLNSLALRGRTPGTARCCSHIFLGCPVLKTGDVQNQAQLPPPATASLTPGHTPAPGGVPGAPSPADLGGLHTCPRSPAQSRGGQQASSSDPSSTHALHEPRPRASSSSRGQETVAPSCPSELLSCKWGGGGDSLFFDPLLS